MSTVTLNGSGQKHKTPEIKNVVSPNYRSSVVDGLIDVLADSYLLNIKTQNYYWNVSGELANQLTKLFEDQHEDLDQAIDDIAKRVRALGFSVPATLIEFKDFTSIKEKTNNPDGLEMVKILAKDNEQVVRTLCSALEPVHEAGDSRTIDMLTARLSRHANNVQDLRAHL